MIDEFQEFQKVDDAIFSEMARGWDEFHRRAKLNLIVSGSVNRLMRKILEDPFQPHDLDNPRVLSESSQIARIEEEVDVWLHGRNVSFQQPFPYHRFSVFSVVLQNRCPLCRKVNA